MRLSCLLVVKKSAASMYTDLLLVFGSISRVKMHGWKTLTCNRKDEKEGLEIYVCV